MTIRTWRFITLLLAALTMGMGFCHTLESPVKLQYDYPLYMAVQHSLYWMFAAVGAVIEVGAILAAGVLSFLVRERRPAFGWTVAGTVLMATALAAWFALVAPMNTQMAQWTTGAPSPDWTQVRAQWEYGHIVHFALQLLGLSLLILSVLLETPSVSDQARELGSVTARSFQNAAMHREGVRWNGKDAE